MNTVYEDLLRLVAIEGSPKRDRTGTGTSSIFGAQMRFDLRYGFPLITTKKVHFKSVVAELLWILSGSTNVKDLQAMGCSIWNEWADAGGDLGPIYGAQWRNWYSGFDERGDPVHIDQIAALIDSIKTKPYDRGHVVSAWNVADLPNMALRPCHAMFQFDVTNGRLSCQLYQRSADMFLGVPFNIASYALLTHMVAQHCSLGLGELIWTGGDCHIYDNHQDQVEEQLSRKPFEFPSLRIKRKPASFFEYQLDDFELVGYQHHPAIKAPVAV